MRVSQLRKLVGKSSVETRPPGYLLRVAPDALDLEQFRRRAAEGELHSALALWRGPPLEEFADQHFATGEIARLQELHLGCLEERIDRDLAGGRHAELVGELEFLVQEHPLREQLSCQLMLALYRSGRQAEALEVYQRAREALVGTLGIDPGRSLRELQQAILQQDPALELPDPEPSPERPPGARETPPPPASEPTSREVRKTVTAVFVGFAVFSPPGERLDPEALRLVVSRAFGEVEAAVERHGGSVEIVADDSVTAVFGLPAAHEDDALRGHSRGAEARDALLALASELTRGGPSGWTCGSGSATGEVITGRRSGRSRWATGVPLTFSSRLGQAAKPGEILVDEATRRLVRDRVVAEQADDAWRLVEWTDAVPAPARRLVSPMVGRERERRRLHDAFDQAVGDRSCQLFTVLGPAGVGKSRLVQEFVGELAGRALVARGRCLPYGEGITFWPVLEAVKEAVGLADGDSPEAFRAKLALALDGEAEGELVAQQVAELIGLAEHGGRRGRLRRGARALRSRRAGPASRSRFRRHPLGRGNVPRPARAHRRLDAGCTDPARLHRPPGAARRSTRLGRRQAERDVGAARAPLRRRLRAG